MASILIKKQSDSFRIAFLIPPDLPFKREEKYYFVRVNILLN